MHYVLICNDKPGSFDLRAAERPRHLDYIRQKGIVAGGPLLDEEERMIGSLLIIEAASRAEAEAFAAEDPYAKAGLFSSVEIRPWRWSINPPQA